MNECFRNIEDRGRLAGAMAMLDQQSRRLMELWLDGRTRREIAMEMRLCEDAASAIIDTAFRELRMLLAG